MINNMQGKVNLVKAKPITLVLPMVFLVLLGINGGCGNKHVPTPQMTFTIELDEKTNQGQPFYIVFRSVSEQQFVTEGYQDVAGMVFANPPNQSVLGTQVVLPGKEYEIEVEKPLRDSLGVYGLYTEPKGEWKVILSKPLSDAYVIEFEKNRITSSEKKGFFRRVCLFGLL
jgi:hypothetical protein